MMAGESSTLLAGALIALGNVGAVGLLVNRTLKKFDATEERTNQHAVLLERATQNQKSTAETLATVQKSIEELYDCRNVHKEQLVAVDTLHEYKGCKILHQGSR